MPSAHGSDGPPEPAFPFPIKGARTPESCPDEVFRHCRPSVLESTDRLRERALRRARRSRGPCPLDPMTAQHAAVRSVRPPDRPWSQRDRGFDVPPIDGLHEHPAREKRNCPKPSAADAPGRPQLRRVGQRLSDARPTAASGRLRRSLAVEPSSTTGTTRIALRIHCRCRRKATGLQSHRRVREGAGHESTRS